MTCGEDRSSARADGHPGPGLFIFRDGWHRRGLAAARSGKAVHPVDVAARHTQRGVMLVDGLFVRPVEQAVHLAPGVVVQLDLAHAELIGPAVAGVIGDLRDGLGGQLQISWKSMNRAMTCSFVRCR
jgi:hypothetical protein